MIKITLCILLLVVFAPIGRSAQVSNVKANIAVQAQVDILANKLAAGEIAQIEILQIPSNILTRTRITPELLEKQFHYKLTIRDVRTGDYLRSFTESTKSIEVHPATTMADLRWGLIFYGTDGSRVGALYFDKMGSSGAVGDAPVSFKGNLFKWLNSFAQCFR